jgi:hypothetical protein
VRGRRLARASSVSSAAAIARRTPANAAGWVSPPRAPTSERDRGELGRVGLGRGDRPLGSGAQVDDVLRGLRERRPGLVRDGDRRLALAAGASTTPTTSGEAPTG